MTRRRQLQRKQMNESRRITPGGVRLITKTCKICGHPFRERAAVDAICCVSHSFCARCRRVIKVGGDRKDLEGRYERGRRRRKA